MKLQCIQIFLSSITNEYFNENNFLLAWLVNPDKMSYSLKFSAKEQYLQVEIDGKVPRIDSAVIIRQAREMCDKYHKSKILLDLRKMTTENSMLADYQDAELLFQEHFEKIAFLDDSEFQLDSDFFSTTATNLGVELKFFHNDEAQAIAWLNE